MKFVISTSDLLKQLQLVGGVVSSNVVLPILENFMFDIKDGKLTITASDMETTMITSIDVDADANGSIAIQAKILMDTLKALPEQPLTFLVDDQTKAIELKSASGKYKLAGESADEFPELPSEDGVAELKIDSKVLANAIVKTIFATANDDMRPAMNGIYVEITPEGTNFVSTDAHKLVRYRRTDATAEESTSFIAPKKSMNILKGALLGDDVEVTVKYNRQNAFFEFGNVTLITRLTDAKYPDYTAVIPTNNQNELFLQRKDLFDSLKRVSIYSNKTTNQAVFNIHQNDLTITAQDLDFSNEASEKIGCTYVGEDMDIAFNAKFLMEMLGVMDTNEVKIQLGAPNRAGILYPTEVDENEDLLMLVMPVMVSH